MIALPHKLSKSTRLKTYADSIPVPSATEIRRGLLVLAVDVGEAFFMTHQDMQFLCERMEIKTFGVEPILALVCAANLLGMESKARIRTDVVAYPAFLPDCPNGSAFFEDTIWIPLWNGHK